jgi:AcrR family transcriptional regulator
MYTEALHEELSPKQIHLVRSTYQAISEKGVHRVSLQEIADRASVSKGVILYYFKSKDQLILRTMQWVLSRTAERIRRAIAGVSSPQEQVLAMIEEIFVEPEANRRFYLTYLDLLDHAARMDQFGRVSATFQSVVNALYEDVIQLGLQEGAFLVNDVEEASITLRAIVDGLFIQWIQETDWERLHPKYEEMCKRAALAYLRADANES